MHWKFFPFINFENPLYFRSERWCLEATFPDTLEPKKLHGTLRTIKEWSKLAS